MADELAPESEYLLVPSVTSEGYEKFTQGQIDEILEARKLTGLVPGAESQRA